MQGSTMFLSAAAVLILAACGGEGAPSAVPPTVTVESATEVVPTETAVPVVTVEPTATAEPEATPTLEPTATLQPTATTIPTPTPVVAMTYDEFGFSVQLDQGAEIQNAFEPSEAQGLISFGLGEVTALLS